MATVSKRSMLKQVRASPQLGRRMLLYKNDDLVAINKPAGVAVHGGPKVKQELSELLPLLQLDFRAEEQLHLAHRIDKNTSGVLLLTRNTSAASRMATMFRERKVVKKYWAVCVGVPLKLKGTIRIPLGSKNMAIKPGRSMHRVVLRPDRGHKITNELVGKTLSGGVHCAVTNYTVVSRSSNSSLLEVESLTGFKHQIRAHLADGLNSPVLGDYKFAGPLFRLSKKLAHKMTTIGRTKGYTRGPMYLHAYQLQVQNEGEPLIITAPPPKYFTQTVASLGLAFPQEFHKLIKKLL